MVIACVTFDTPENQRHGMTARTLLTLFQTVNLSKHRVYVIDNGSTDPTTIDLLKECAESQQFVVILNKENIGTARAANMAWQLRQPGEHCCKMDNDVVIHHAGWADEMEEVFRRDPTYGIIGLKRKDLAQRPDHPEKLWRSELVMLPHRPGERWLVVEESKDIVGTCTGFSSALLDKIGYLYQGNLLYGYDDTLACIRAHKAGFKTAFIPWVEIDHIDPGGTEFTTWKQKRATDTHWAYQRWAREFETGARPVYCGPKDD